MKNTIHWLGAGLSSIPGIKRLAQGQHPLIVWNRSLSKAQSTLAGIEDENSKPVKIAFTPLVIKNIESINENESKPPRGLLAISAPILMAAA